MIQELIHRDGLRNALSGRDDVLLEPVLRLLVKHVADPRFGEIVCDISMLLIGKHPPYCTGTIVTERNIYQDMYAPVLGQSPLIDSLFLRLRKKVVAEIRQPVAVFKRGKRTVAWDLPQLLHPATT